MSSQAQILIEDVGIYLYDQFGSGPPENPSILAPVYRALRRHMRMPDTPRSHWSDPIRLASIIFQEMVKEHMDHCAKMREKGFTVYNIEDGIVLDRFGIENRFHSDVEFLVALNCSAGTMKTKGSPLVPVRGLSREEWEALPNEGAKREIRQCSFHDFEKMGVEALRIVKK